jgi:kynurenine formamidase
VVLDLRHKEPGERISTGDLERALEAIGYALKPLDIVMLMTGRDRFLGDKAYFEQPA